MLGSQVKSAQAITGALLWVATRTRPDISDAVARIGQQAMKTPELSLDIGHHGRGVPLAWEATRQIFTTLSSARAELVCVVHGIQLVESVQPLVDELLETDTLLWLLAENAAAI